jgi:hypothetical protein
MPVNRFTAPNMFANRCTKFNRLTLNKPMNSFTKLNGPLNRLTTLKRPVNWFTTLRNGSGSSTNGPSRPTTYEKS